MNVDLETRLRRAASVLEDETVARVDHPPLVVDPDSGARRTRRFLVAAAACVIAVAGAAVVVQVADRDDAPGEPSPPTQPPATAPPLPAFLQPGWNRLPAAPIARRIQHHTVATEHGVLVWGGWTPGDQASALQANADGAFLDMTTGTWQRTPDAPFAAEGNDEVAVAVGDQVILMTESDTELVTFSYHADSNSWETLPAPPPGIWPGSLSLAPLTIGEKVYFVQASRAVDDEVALRPPALAIYDTVSRTWSLGAPPPDDLAILWGTKSSDALIVTGVHELPHRSTCPSKTYTYSPRDDAWTYVSTSDTDVSTSDGAMTIAASTWTGDALFAATPDACPYLRRDFEPRGHISPRPTAQARVLDVVSGTSETFAAPQMAVSNVGIWTGSAVSYIGTSGLPVFYNPSTEHWHEAQAPGGAGFDLDAQQASERARYVWSNGALVTWGGTTTDAETPPAGDDVTADGWAYVPPPEFGG
jgi:hypothetical protein